MELAQRDQKPPEIARQAAGLISTRGLAKGMHTGPDGSLCLFGALLRAGGTEMALTAAAREVLEEAERITAGRGQPVPVAFNNLPETSQEDVILLLKETAARLDAQAA